MYWLKRHLVVILLLAGGIGFSIFGMIFRSEKVKTMANAESNLENVINEVNRILKPPQSSVDDYTGQDLKPTDGNIQAARMVRGATQALIDQASTNVMDEPTVLIHERSDAFRVELEKMIAELTEQAEDRRVELPSTNRSYKFSFTNLVGKTSISRDKLTPLSYQMSDIQTIFGVLARSRIKKLVSIKRVPEAPDDFQAIKDGYKHFLTRPYGKYTNAIAVVTPYSVTFTTLSRAVPKAIGEFARSQKGKGLFIVRKVEIQTEEDHKKRATRFGTGGGGGDSPFSPGAAPGGVPGAPPGAPSPFPTTPRPTSQGVPTGASKAITVLDEKVLRVELFLDVYRPIKQEKPDDPNALNNPNPAAPAPVAPPTGL